MVSDWKIDTDRQQIIGLKEVVERQVKELKALQDENAKLQDECNRLSDGLLVAGFRVREAENSVLDLERAVAFAVFMQHGNGITSKAPDYILEKLEACRTLNDPSVLMDRQSEALYREWLSKWSQYAKAASVLRSHWRLIKRDRE